MAKGDGSVRRNRCSGCGRLGHRQLQCLASRLVPGKPSGLSAAEEGLRWLRERKAKIEDTISLLEDVVKQERNALKIEGRL